MSCEDDLAAANAQVEAIVKQINELGPINTALLQKLREANTTLAQLAGETPRPDGSMGLDTLTRIYERTLGGGGQGGGQGAAQETTETRPASGISPTTALQQRAVTLNERLARLEAKT